jgi:UDP-2,3-diacylglucosamine pyrophosphatase LpxH
MPDPIYVSGAPLDEILELLPDVEVVGSFSDVEDGELTDTAEDVMEDDKTERRLLTSVVRYLESKNPPPEWFGPTPPPPVIFGEELDNEMFDSVMHLVSDVHLDNRDGMTGWFSARNKQQRLASCIDWLRRDAVSHAARFPSATPRLHIVGDLFDIWQGCGKVRPNTSAAAQRGAYAQALLNAGARNPIPLRALRRYHDAGFPIIYTAGNHDMEIYTHNLQGVARNAAGIPGLRFSPRVFLEPRFHTIGLHGHQADIYNAEKNIDSRWCPGEILVRNGNNPWLRWEGAPSLRMFVLALDPPNDGIEAMESLIEFGQIRPRVAERLLRQMIDALTYARILDGTVAAFASGLLDTVGPTPTPTTVNVLNTVLGIPGLVVSTLRHLAIPDEPDSLEVDGDEVDGDNDRHRRLFERVYEENSDGEPIALSDLDRDEDDLKRISLSKDEVRAMHRAAGRLNAVISVSGHTHQPELSGDSRRVYLNLGAWTDRWKFASSNPALWASPETIQYAFDVSTVSRVYKIWVAPRVHDIVVESFQFLDRPRLLARRRLRVRYS